MTPQEKLENFFFQFKSLFLRKGDTFLRAGDIPQGVFYLKKGYVRLYSLCSEGKELTLVIYKPGDFFPVVWTFTSKPSIYYFETLSRCEIIRATKDKFQQFIDDNPDVLDDVIFQIIERFQVALSRMESLTFGNAKSKIASALLIYSKRLGVKKEGGEIQIPVSFTHKDIANLVGMTRETVSIELKKLIDKGILIRRGKLLFVKKRSVLEREA
ncbi:MAG: hypothetical protein A2958_01465 [Candidatus Levybacteria bacterium RIFCSPLOWO2_01_FULL_38_13]|nr:MAG: hypothetical protein A2629_01605 [Candidatus Levybacteria bacterium RIFCSPHIGHO2_01_FULL_41_15]OGH34617.1 MAG: hypothetical protein A2958_01465 [Candidatus Levybacteria bacterium RIFCSPLOWO2_01_FULL_38_13]